jgi:phosphoglycerol transferase
MGIGLKNLVLATKDWRNLAFIAALAGVAAWVYSRVQMVNPAILGDEYLYSVNARHAAPWDPSPAGDFSNYLFNLVYSSTNLCGEAFYTCGKILNLGFFLGFLIVVFIIAKRFLNYWVAFAFTIAAGLSPLSVYTSMFLPESMYFFMLSLVFLAVLRAADSYAWKDWALVGALVGVASLVKPHAWLSAIAIGIFLVVLGLTQAKHRFKPMFKAIGAISLAAILGRVIIGFIVAGPKALGFFGIYLTGGTLGEITAGVPADIQEGASAVGTSPINGVISLFGTQLNIHMLTMFALMGIAIIGLAVGLVQLIRTRELTKVTSLALFVFIWLFSLVIEIVMFTGWITGSGDDHTTRVLERYYDFLFVFVPLAGLAVLSSKFASEIKVWIRIPLAVIMLVFITPAFSGFFGNLTIQIADAPNLAGLVVNQDIFNTAAMIGFLSLLVFSFFPKYTPWVFALMLPVTMVGTGFQIQDQYQGFRGELNDQDRAGQFLNQTLSDEDVDATWIIATSRFEATNVAIWADSPNIKFDLYGPGSTLDPSMAPEGSKYILVTGDLIFTGEFAETIAGDGYTLYKLK